MPYDSPVTRKVMVVGSGGREHALALALLDSPSVDEVVVCPGNAGTEGGGLRNAVGTPLGVAQAEAPALVVVGPEAPLCEGLVDDLAGRGILAFGPSREAARLEGSKSFMKSFAKRHGLPTARHIVLERVEDVAGAAREFALPPVVKADGLCAGKGVVVSQTHDEAIEAARGMLSGQSFGEAGLRVVMEERLEGVEASVHAICDGERALVLPAAQDHKRIGDGDTGPNTGGMGSYAPTPLVSPALMDRVREQIVLPAVRGMAADGHPYRGALFAGLMISPSGEPRLLEFNVRFGDPETQVLMAILRGDLAEALGTVWVPEYARTYLEALGRDPAYEDMALIGKGQAASEAALAPSAERFLVTDTDALETAVWSEALFGRTDPALAALAAAQRYDLTLLCATDVPFEPDPVRYLPDARQTFFDACEAALTAHGRRYVVLRGDRALHAWTFAGTRANRLLAAWLRELGLEASASDLAVRVGTTVFPADEHGFS